MSLIGKISLNNSRYIFFKTLTLIFLSCFFYFTDKKLVEAYSSDPKNFVSEVIQEAITVLNDNNLSLETKNSKIETIALNTVDIKALGLYSLGEARKSLSPEKISQYQELFQKYFIKSLNSRLVDYSKQKIDVVGYEILNEDYTMVNTKILGSGSNPEIKVDWRVYTKNIDSPLIRDLIIEGLSLARTQREEFSSILASNDNKIESLFLKLEEFIK